MCCHGFLFEASMQKAFLQAGLSTIGRLFFFDKNKVDQGVSTISILMFHAVQYSSRFKSEPQLLQIIFLKIHRRAISAPLG